MRRTIRVLLLADSHLGFDLPNRARVSRRHRGHDFLANYAAALQPALRGEVDVMVHGGDVFDRPRIPASLAYQALRPLVRIAERGIPVLVVPGNHERSCLPHDRFASHRNVHVFDRPRTFVVVVAGTAVSVTGFPYERHGARARFRELLGSSEWAREPATIRLLCMHQCVEGATVGPGDFTFTSAADVVRASEIPPAFTAVLAGHIHRHQALTTDLHRRALSAPVLYPGSLERTSLAELDEEKGYMVVQLETAEAGAAVRWEFRRLPARPMIVQELATDGLTSAALDSALRDIVAAAPRDAVLRIRVVGDVTGADSRLLSAAHWRRVAPETMNIEITHDAWYRAQRAAPRRATPVKRNAAVPLQLELG
jgi:DNA repair protein SbcD/Mre11